jgi:hypothetical protein
MGPSKKMIHSHRDRGIAVFYLYNTAQGEVGLERRQTRGAAELLTILGAIKRNSKFLPSLRSNKCR